jgi:hypothetical protein
MRESQTKKRCTCFVKEMKRSDFGYQSKPAFVSFLNTYLFCFGIGFLLIVFSPLISHQLIRLMGAELELPASHPLRRLPYGAVFSLPFLIYGLRTLLWNVMSGYEFSSSRISLLTGSLVRKEHFFSISDFCDVSFKQNLFEAPLGIGKMTLTERDGGRLVIGGVHDVKYVVEALRAGISSSEAREPYGARYAQSGGLAHSAAPSDKHKSTSGWSAVLSAVIIIVLSVFFIIVFKAEVFASLQRFVRGLFAG